MSIDIVIAQELTGQLFLRDSLTAHFWPSGSHNLPAPSCTEFPELYIGAGAVL